MKNLQEHYAGIRIIFGKLPVISCALSLQAFFAAIFFVFLAGCNAAAQPNYAQAYQEGIRQAAVVPRTVTFSPTMRGDAKLDVQMLSVTEEGALLLRSLFGINELQKGHRKLLNGQYVVLLDADPEAQIARLKTWPKPVF